MTGPLEIVGDQDAPVCVDGVCEVPVINEDPGVEEPSAHSFPRS